jgi:hypothetical protein
MEAANVTHPAPYHLQPFARVHCFICHAFPYWGECCSEAHGLIRNGHRTCISRCKRPLAPGEHCVDFKGRTPPRIRASSAIADRAFPPTPR